VPVFAGRRRSLEEYWWAPSDADVGMRPANMILDDGGDATRGLRGCSVRAAGVVPPTEDDASTKTFFLC